MRIAYLTDINLYLNSGVQKKHFMQLNAWKKLGHEAKIFSVPAEMEKGVSYKGQEDVVMFDHPFSHYSGHKGVNVYLRKMLTSNKLIRALREFNPDIVYAREVLWFPGLEKIVRLFPVVWEANTLLFEEIKVTSHPVIRFFNERYMPSVYKVLRGVVGVTYEISASFKPYSSTITTIANGIDMEKYITINLPSSEPDKINVVFVGSPGMSWHGVDHFCEMARLTPFAEFHLVGPMVEEAKGLSNIHQYGYLDAKELYALYERMDIAVGTLALYRKSMMEACPLKVREYCAFGLPTIIAYYDTDLSGADFILEIDNNSESVVNNIKKIHNFIDRWKGRRVDKAEIMPLIECKSKEEKRLKFMEMLCHTT